MSTTQHPTPPDGWNAFQAKKQHEGVYSDDNAHPESRGLTNEDRQIFTLARAAVNEFKKSFESWMTIGLAIVVARKHANATGGKRKKEEFLRILERQGISIALGMTASSIRSTAQRLEKIMEHELEVRAWHNGLCEAEKIAWASPTAIYKHCHVFQRKAELDGEKERQERKPTPTERIKELEIVLEAEKEAHAADIACYESAPLPEPMWRDPGEGLMSFYNAWKPLHDVLKDEQAFTIEHRLQVLDKLEYDLHELRKSFDLEVTT